MVTVMEKKQTGIKKIYSGKNIGKTNETTVSEQAALEAKSIWQKKYDKGYRETVPTGTDRKSPMLAHKYEDRYHKLIWPLFAQPKLDGVRCISKKVSEDAMDLKSRNGKDFYNLGHLEETLLTLLAIEEEVDGELYSHTMTFEEIISCVRSKNKVPENVLDIEYWLYDMPSDDLPFEYRLDRLRELLINIGVRLKLVETVEIEDEESLLLYHQQNIALGFEGTMIRNKKGLYKYNHRSVDLLKLKDFLDDDFEIIGGKDSTGSSEGQCVFRCKMINGNEFDVRCIGEAADREEQLNNLDNYIGKMLTVKYQRLSDTGVPIFPVGIAVRDYE